MQSFGFATHGRIAFGEVQGYPCAAEKLSAGDSGDFAFRFAVNGLVRGAAKALRTQKLEHVRWHADVDIQGGGVLVAMYTPPSDFYARAGIHTLMTAAVTQLKAENLSPPDECPLCQLTGCDVDAWLEGELRPAHAACLKTRLDLPEADHSPPPKRKGNLALGILGAVLGALLGAVPVWALMLNRGMNYMALYAFIPILSGLAYRSLRGKASVNAAAAAVLASSVAATFLLELIWYQLVLSATMGANIPFTLSVPIYFQQHSFLSAIQGMLFCLLFMLVGYLVISVVLRRTFGAGLERQVTIRGAKFIRDTALPKGGLKKPEAAENTSKPQGEQNDERTVE